MRCYVACSQEIQTGHVHELFNQHIMSVSLVCMVLRRIHHVRFSRNLAKYWYRHIVTQCSSWQYQRGSKMWWPLNSTYDRSKRSCHGNISNNSKSGSGTELFFKHCRTCKQFTPRGRDTPISVRINGGVKASATVLKCIYVVDQFQ